MCGIAGYFGERAKEEVENALKVMKYRGKDFSLVKVVRGGAIGHNLHAVVGFVPQPFFEDDKWFVANCEIYNWRQLAEKYEINARNDAELLFKLLLDKGVKVLAEIDGPYAFAFYDGSEMILARDPFGIFPLFYSLNPLAFASERKAFPNLRELHPRHIIIFDGEMEEKYWKRYKEKRGSIEKLEEAIRNAVKKRICDEQTLFFSGGLDSSLLAYFLKEEGANFEAVVVGLKGSKDVSRAERVAEVLGIKLHKVEVSGEEIRRKAGEIARLIESSDPVKVEVGLVTYFASLASHTKVSFSGLGADELFGGYARMHRSPAFETLWALRNIYERSTYRDNVAGFAGGTEIRLPFLDKEVVEIALGLPENYKVRKEALKQIAKSLGIPVYEKKAAQYGSGFSRVLPRPKARYLANFWPKNRKIAALVSGGKDSWYALYVMYRLNYEIACIIALRPKKSDSWMFHFPFVEKVKEQAKSAGIPLIFKETSGRKEEELEALKNAVREAKERFGIEGIVSGAISSVYQRSRIEDIAEKEGIACYAPLWGINQESYLKRLVKDGFKFVIVSVAADGLDESWVGREIGWKEAREIIELSRKYKFNPAGEGGEYETFVKWMPLFRYPIDF